MFCTNAYERDTQHVDTAHIYRVMCNLSSSELEELLKDTEYLKYLHTEEEERILDAIGSLVDSIILEKLSEYNREREYEDQLKTLEDVRKNFDRITLEELLERKDDLLAIFRDFDFY